MKLLKVDVSPREDAVEFILWVWCRDEWREKEGAYVFKWRNEKISFMYGGWTGEPRYVGYAKTQEEALKLAEPWLEEWLKKCGAI